MSLNTTFTAPQGEPLEKSPAMDQRLEPPTVWIEPSSVDEVYYEILLRIVREELPSGSVLTSTRLAKQLGVSRTPIAAALERLVADGLLKKEHNRRAVVRYGAEQWILQIHQLREIVEPPATALAAATISEETLQNLDRACQLANPQSSDQWLIASRQFDTSLHLAIADACGNLALRQTIYRCWSFKQLVFDQGYDDPRMSETGFHEHQAILQALKRRDPSTASAAMLFHLRSAFCLRADVARSTLQSSVSVDSPRK